MTLPRSPLVLAAAAVVLCIAPPAQAREVTFSVSAGPLSSAISDFSRDSGVQIIARPEVLKGKRTAGLKGRMSVERGLALLLRGTGLTSRRRGNVILIVSTSPGKRSGRASPTSDSVPRRTVRRVATPIVVTGQRVADQLSIEAKTQAVNIVDAVSSDDMQRLPDTTIVDAMRRVPGVSVVAIADNEHPRDVPIAPVVRGLTQAYNNVTMNGMPIASTGVPDTVSNSASRGGRMDVLPASAVSQLTVIKTFTPDLDPNAIGGAIDMTTHMPLSGGRQGFVMAEAGVSSTSQRSQVRPQAPMGTHATVTGSHVFGEDRRLGVMLSANYQRLDNNSNVHGTSDSTFFNYYDDAGHRVRDRSLSNGIVVPRQDKYWYNESVRERWGMMAALEARPNERLSLSALAGLYRFNDGYTRNEVIISASDADNVGQMEDSGRYDSGTVQIGYRNGMTHSTTRVLQLSADWQASSSDRVSLRGSLSSASLDEAYEMVKFTAGVNEKGEAVGTAPFGFAYDSSAFHHSFNIARQAYEDLSLYAPSYWRNRWRQANSTLQALRADWQHNMGKADTGLGLAAGAAWKASRYEYVYFNEEYRSLNPALSLRNVGYVAQVPLRWNQSGLNLISVDPVAAWRMFEANQDTIFKEDNTDDNLEDNFDQREQVLAGYATVRLARGPWEWLAGGRLEQTRVETRANRKVVDEWGAVKSRSQYLRFLPSIIASYSPQERLRLRAAYSRTIGRPGFEAYAPNEAISFPADVEEGDPDAWGVEVSLGNPDIKPRMADNFDFALEWELPPEQDGLLSATLFHKRIGNEIFDSVTTGYAMDGIYYSNAQVTQPANASSAHISGLELGATIGSLAFVSPLLESIGFNANWTVLRGRMVAPVPGAEPRRLDELVGQPTEIRNLSVFYNRGGFALRGAMNWTGQALRSLQSDDPWQDVYWAPRRQYDVQARYRFASGISLVLDVANLTEERLVSLAGPHQDWLKDSYSVPRTVRLSLNATLGGSAAD